MGNVLKRISNKFDLLYQNLKRIPDFKVFWSLLLVSAVLGMSLSLKAGLGDQVATETAQVISGKVTYSATNTFHIYHQLALSIIHIPAALFLQLGASETAVSALIGLLLASIGFAALSAITWALTRHALLALVTPLLVYLSGTWTAALNYPVAIFGGPHTYGILGLNVLLLVVGLLGSKRFSSGLFFLGLFPAVHPSLAFWGYVAVFPCLLLSHQIRISWRRHILWFGLGFVVSAVYLTWGLWPRFESADRAFSKLALDAWFRWWDGHREPILFPSIQNLFSSLFQPAVPHMRAWALYLSVIPLLIFLSYKKIRPRMPDGAWLTLGPTSILALLFGLTIPISHIDPSHLPSFFFTAMPHRLINFFILFAPVLFISVPFLLPSGPLRWGMGLLMIALFSTNIESKIILESWIPPFFAYLSTGSQPDFLRFLAALVSLILLCGLLWHPEGKTLVIVRNSLFALACVALILIAAPLCREWRGLPNYFRQATIEQVEQKPPALLAFDDQYFLYQLHTGQPVFYNAPAWDQFPMATPAIRKTMRILKEIYGLDLFLDPRNLTPPGRETAVYSNVQKLWESRGPSDWKKLREEYGFGEIISPYQIRDSM